LINNKNGSYSGYCVDIMNSIAKTLNITYEIHVPDDKKYGTFENGTWNGIMKELIDGVSVILSHKLFKLEHFSNFRTVILLVEHSQ
jgi:hypothetical protein